MVSRKVAIVTGASRGIGKATAIELARAGYKVVVNYINSLSDAKKTETLIKETGSECLLFEADVSSRNAVTSLVETTLKTFGRIDVLVNNAGFLEQKKFENIDDQEWLDVFNINLGSAFICTQEVAKSMKNGGSIVNVSSIGGQIGGPNAPHYSAAKGALITFTKSVARLLADRQIRVNAVAPGYIETDMFSSILKYQKLSADSLAETVPLKRLGNPNDVASAISFLISSNASYITGHTLNINGGLLI